ncbi:hypothetical protein N7510_005181 [Penicillium lagena]|uniref:uncharacterized protein n=1 Tax=Penicillium lagena TaxID=94218 RepID=UPI0025407F6F|nr:uncharacterized protein N7510_005181 [Penicillium lagena]KAJ5611987.1 hypothetical protein N7510_005181 [Penicillium lagena]
MTPLCLGINFGFPADVLHIDRQTLAWFHRWTGHICVLHSLLHGSFVVSNVRKSMPPNPNYIITILAGCALILVGPVTCVAIRQRHRQLALKCHYVLAAVAIAAIEYHLFQQESPYCWVLLGAVCLWFLCSSVVCMRTILTHKPWQGSPCKADIWVSQGVLWIEINLPIGRAIRPGEYIHMWAPCAGYRAFTQLVLLYVVVAELENVDSGCTIRMVARPQRGVLYHSSFARRQPVAILGPYGRPYDFSRYGTIVFALEDIGLFRALSYIEMLVEASHKREAMVRKVEVLWQREKAFENPEWFKLWRQKILNFDRENFDILHFRIFCHEPTEPAKGPRSSRRLGERLWLYNGPIDFEEEISRYLDEQCGDMALAVCAGPRTREAVRKSVQLHLHKSPQIVELDLGPYHTWPDDRISSENRYQGQNSQKAGSA